jgi:hypothetical protein
MRSLLVAFATLVLASSAQATPRLFATTGAGLYEIDPATAASHLIATFPASPTAYGDIAARPGDLDHIYGVKRLPGTDYRNVLSSIDVDSGVATELYDFVPADLGLAPGQALELTGLSISPAIPSTATIMAAVLDFVNVSVHMVFFDLDLDTGVMTNLTASDQFAESLTESPSGTIYTLDALATEYKAATVDRASGQITDLGDGFCATAPQFCTDAAIEFDPGRGELLVVERGGRLIRVSPITGANVGAVGQTGLPIVTGLAFVHAPEPGTAALLVLGLVGYGLASNGRGGSRQSSRRA